MDFREDAWASEIEVIDDVAPSKEDKTESVLPLSKSRELGMSFKVFSISLMDVDRDKNAV